MGSNKRIVRIAGKRRISMPRPFEVGSWYAFLFGLFSLSILTFYGQNCGTGGVQTGGTLALSPASGSVVGGTTVSFVATGGTPPYTYSLVEVPTGTEAISSSSGLYAAPTTAKTAQIKVTDALGVSVTSTITVTDPATSGGELLLTPATQTVSPRGTVLLTATGGTAPYTFRISSGGYGTVVASSTTTATYTAPASVSISSPTDIVTVQDSLFRTATASMAISATASSSQILLSASSTTITPGGGPITLTISGGTQPYTIGVIPPLPGSNFTPVTRVYGTQYYSTFTPPPSISSSLGNSVTFYVSDSADYGASQQMSVRAAANGCAGVYTLYTYSAGQTCDPLVMGSPNWIGTLTLNGNSDLSPTGSGSLLFNDGYQPSTVSGVSCTPNSTTGSISFARMRGDFSQPQVYVGSFTADSSDPAILRVSGTFTGQGVPAGQRAGWCAVKR